MDQVGMSGNSGGRESGDLPLEVMAAGLHHEVPKWKWSFDGHHHNWRGFILGSVFNGEGFLEYPGTQHRLVRGSVYLLHLQTHPYVLRNSANGTLELGWVYFETHAPIRMPNEHQLIGNVTFWEQLMHRVIECAQAKRRDLAANWLRVAFLELKGPVGRIAILNETQTVHLPAIEAVCHAMRADPARRWTPPEMARQAHLSPPHFNRIFRLCKGTSPGRFLVSVRMDAARSYLRGSDHSVSDIAGFLGYQDPFVFSHQFKKEVGHSPQAYRQLQNGTFESLLRQIDKP